MKQVIGGVATHYQRIGQGDPLVLLHGWGCDWQIWSPLITALSETHTLIIPDLPAFGQSQAPEKVWNSQDYLVWLENLVIELRLEQPNFVGHSFGGKLAALWAAKHAKNTGKLILIDSAGAPIPLSLNRKVQQLIVSAVPAALKNLLSHSLKNSLLRLMGVSTDHAQADAYQRQVLRRVIGESILAELPHISAPTLLIWGEQDPDTPLSAGRQLAGAIPGSRLAVLPGVGHFPFIEQPVKVLELIGEHLGVQTTTASPVVARSTPKRALTSQEQLTTLLAILQQSEYHLPDFQLWIQRHEGQELPVVVPPRWTLKLKLVRALSNCFFRAKPVTRITRAVQLLMPFDLAARLSYIAPAFLKLRFLQLRGLKVIAVAGSFGKTSTKHYLQTLLGDQVSLLATPTSFNTPMGIAQVVRTQLTSQHQVFVVEFGEHFQGDLRLLCWLTWPDLAILTPLGHQHLDRLGGWRGVVAVFQEVLSYFKNRPGKILLADVNQAHYPESTSATYGLSSAADFQLSVETVTRAGSEGAMKIGTQESEFFSPLFGEGTLMNTLPAWWVAGVLGLDQGTLKGKLATLTAPERRLEPKHLSNGVLLLDNSYNTNPDSAPMALKLLSQLAASRRIVITAGFLEAGEDSEQLNESFGKSIGEVAEYLGVLNTPWAPAITRGFLAAGRPAGHIMSGTSQAELLSLLQPVIIPQSVILIEGGYQEIYG